MPKTLLALLLFITGLLLLGGTASAKVPDAPWNATGSGIHEERDGNQLHDESIRMRYAIAQPSATWKVEATATEARSQPVKWAYDGRHLAKIERFVIRKGIETAGTLASPSVPPTPGFKYDGMTTFELLPGDQYGFRMKGSDGEQGVLTGEFEAWIADVTPPTIVPTITGTLGKDGIYTSDVKLTWAVADASSEIRKRTGCDAVDVTADTAGRTFTCNAQSAGGKVDRSVTIKRDATAPAITVPATLVREGGAADGLVVDYAASARDTVDATPDFGCSPASGSKFALGATRVTCTATDDAGHSATREFDVIVLRAPKPAPAPAGAPTPAPAPAPQVTQVHVAGPVTITQPPAAKALNPVLAFRFTVTKRITRLKQLTVKNLAAGSTVTISCKGASCPRRLKGRTHAVRITKSKLDLSRLARGPLKAGTVITVVVTSPDAVTATRKLTVRKNGAPRLG